jgi:putative DNA primase/helicase
MKSRSKRYSLRTMPISWEAIQRITQGRLGRAMAICPCCSENRRTPQKRQSKVLAVTLFDPEFAVYYCNHCEAQGYCRPDFSPRVFDLAEHQRRRDEATRLAETEKQERTRRALAIYDEGNVYSGSPAENYLSHTREIGNWLEVFPHLDQVFRYHPNCPFGDERLPCMLALVRNIKTNAPVAVHRTALKLGKRPEQIDRKSLGPTAGGAIKISPDHEVHSGLLVGEGIETILSASKELRFKPVWSLIDKGNLAKFPVISAMECLTIAVDNDESGTGQLAALECSGRWTDAGREVFRLIPNQAGDDFNDIVRRRSP